MVTDWDLKKAADEILQKADVPKKRRPQRQSRRRHQVAVDKARFQAEMEIYERRPKPADKGES